MKKMKLTIITALTLLLTGKALAANTAVEININGIGPAVDNAAFTNVKQTIGLAVANGVLEKFEVRGYGIEGGFSACAQASRFGIASFPAFVQQLKAIKANPQTTAYSVKTVPSCVQAIKFCTQEVKICPDGSFVGRVAPSCAFAPCPGN